MYIVNILQVGPAIAIAFLIKLGWYIFLLGLLIFAVVNRKNRRKATAPFILFICLFAFTLYLFINSKKEAKLAMQKFLGDYKLEQLDGIKCDSCKVTLQNNYTYIIIEKRKIVGTGNWEIGEAMDIPPGWFKLDNGPGIVWEFERFISSINRRSK